MFHPALQGHGSPNISERGEIIKFITGGYYIDDKHLLHGPNVIFRPIPEAYTQPKIVPRTAVLHTNAASRSASSLWSWITSSTVTGEPHFQVGYTKVEQYMPLNVRADCNYSVNRWQAAGGEYFGAISFETQDNGSQTLNTTPWTLEQVHAMVGILTNLCACYGIQCTQPAVWNASGIGHHSLFPYQGPLYKSWTNVYGKTCPGAARIAQMDQIRHLVAVNLAAYINETGWKCGQRF